MGLLFARLMRYFTAIVLLAVSMLAIPAQAYVLPADYILRLMLDVQAKHKIKDASLKLTSEVRGQPQASSERLYIKTPERLRLLGEDESAELYVEREGTRAEGSADSLERLKTLPTNLLASLRFPKGDKSDERIERLLGLLAQVGVDTSVTALGRFDNESVYIIGARPFETESPQIWVGKDRLQPVKTVLFTGPGATGDRVEYRFLDYGGSSAGGWFPGIIELWIGDQLVKKQTVAEARTNQDLPETLFEVP